MLDYDIVLFKKIDFIKNANDYYALSDGRVWSAKTNTFVKQYKSKKGYMNVMLYLNKDEHNKYKVKRFQAHRIVAQAFIPNPNNLPQINHKDEDKTNNNINNLEWCTNEYNHNYGNRNKNQSNTMKEKYRLGLINKHTRPVFMCDINTHKIIKEFDSIVSAERYFGKTSGTNIRKVCKNKFKQALGYWWCYKENYNNGGEL